MRELFNFRGRASRLTYWRVQLLSLVLAGAVLLLGDFATQAFDRAGGVVYAGFLPIFVITLATVVKRLHDRNRGFGWALFFLGYPLASQAAAHPLIESASPWLVMAGSLLALGGFGVSVWSLVEIGFLRGSATANRFGDPVAI